MTWLDKYLVPEWRDAWRMFSVQLAALVAAIGGVVTANPDILLQLAILLPMGGFSQLGLIGAVVLAVFIVPAFTRLWKQQEANDAEQG